MKRKAPVAVGSGSNDDLFLHHIRKAIALSAEVSSLPCREREIQQLTRFFSNHIEQRTVGSMYISGAPGTGKTASVTRTIDAMEAFAKKNKLPAPRFVYINGVSLETQGSGAIFHEIYRQFTGDDEDVEDPVRLLEAKLLPSRKNKNSRSVFVIIDEIDALLLKSKSGSSKGTGAQSPLYRLFDWPARKNAIVSVIGIANRVDLIQRLLPMLKVKNLEPETIIFEPYNETQIGDIIISRIQRAQETMKEELHSKTAAPEMPFEGRTLELLARKIAAHSGDARQALDVFGQAVVLAVAQNREKKQKVSVPQTGLGTATGPLPRKPLTSLSHVSRSIKASFGSKHVSSVRALPREAAVLLVAIVIRQKKSKAAVSVMDFYSTYSALKRKLKMDPVSFPVCAELVSRLEQAALVSMGKGHGRQQKMRATVPFDDVEYALAVGGPDSTFYARLFAAGTGQ